VCYALIPCAVLLITPEKDCDVVYCTCAVACKSSRYTSCCVSRWNQNQRLVRRGAGGRARRRNGKRSRQGCCSDTASASGGSILVHTTCTASSAIPVNVCGCQRHQWIALPSKRCNSLMARSGLSGWRLEKLRRPEDQPVYDLGPAVII
jgi:hypothetical protein